MDKDKICISEFVCFLLYLSPSSPPASISNCLKQDLNLDNADYSALHNQCLLFPHISMNQVFFSFSLHAYSTCNRSQKVVKSNIKKSLLASPIKRN